MKRIIEREALDAEFHYDQVAEQYSMADKDIENLTSGKIFELSSSHLFHNVLDIGCGTGRYFPFIYGCGKFVGHRHLSQNVRYCEGQK